ncbi:histidine decarboxylase [Methylocystis sp. ATCC 49242]|uniref:histidine decarboxylase n=1 Tax=Methylocystis sp. ATCC 49242 TaxID=622637 RepID=UPI0001F87FE7|nr:histidine decarboxylase [Methylocystis sp. ATCC 49242]
MRNRVRAAETGIEENVPRRGAGALDAASAARLDRLHDELQARAATMIGYPTNFCFDYPELERFHAFSLNNVGDPFDDNLYGLNTHEFEREVIEFFAQLYHIQKPNYWGYVTNGGTEGNMYGLYLAREICPNGVVYFSEDTHYSVMKIVHVLNMKHIVLRSQENGEMRYDDLSDMLRFNRDKPAILLANIGTTMKGAIDDLGRIRAALHDNAIHHHYIHCDAALAGMTLPFMKDAPAFDFAAGADSIAVSGHKFIGMPTPSGVVVARRNNVERVKSAIEYIGASDTTISGSRNGLSTLMLWRAIHALGRKGFEARVRACLDQTQYALARLAGVGWPAWANRCSNIVVLKRPPQEIVRKWQLAVKDELAHIILMPHVGPAQIDAFVDDLSRVAPAHEPRRGPQGRRRTA